jgi:CRISPR/Cas system CMR subunit Cmr4 (Cas7 group RAMP superfamily)
MLSYLFGKLPEYLQIGGNETTGKGICKVVKGGA